ncbi:MAG: hypothetical protein IJL17_07180 [Kiritimatiellae bacterium]|nr:hypothetical protein [Kiritimatiellia bacterium]
MMLQPLHPVVRAAPLDATVAVRDERALEEFMRVVVEEVVYHPVAEFRREHLAHLRVVDDVVPEVRLRAHAPVRKLQQLAHGKPEEVHVLLLLLGVFPYHLVFRDAAVEQPRAAVVGAHELARRDEPDLSRLHFGFVFQAVLNRCHIRLSW